MYKNITLAALVAIGSAHMAYAQESPNSHTLQEQMDRVLSGQPAVSGSWNEAQAQAQAQAQATQEPAPVVQAEPAAQPAAPVQQQAAPTYREWPPSAVAPAAGTQPAPAARVYRSVAPDGEVINSIGGDAIPALPLEIRTVGDIRYITGGVGDEEKAQLKMVEQDYNFQLLIAGNGGAFIGGAMVRILDKDGKLLLSTDGAGPYLYATLPSGEYTVEVTAPDGGIKSSKVKVPATGVVKPVMRFTV